MILDISEIKIDRRKPKVENLYVFKVDGHLVQTEFTNNGKTAEGCLTNALSNLYK